MELDKDLQARQEARLLAKQAKAAQRQLAQMSQSQLDKIVEAIAEASAKRQWSWQIWRCGKPALAMWRIKR